MPRTVAPTSGSSSYASATTVVQKGERFSAAIVLVFIFATAALSLYDLYMLLAFLGG